MNKCKYKKIIIGIDQSYKNTGISIAADGKLKKVHSVHLEHLKNNSEKRSKLKISLDKIIARIIPQAECVEVIIERIRLRSQGFLNIDYIKSIGALNALIVDLCNVYGIKVSSVDTRCWKAQVVGTSKPGPKNNFWNMEPEKYPTFEWLKQNYPLLIPSVFIDMSNTRKKKNVFELQGKLWKINDDACDSAAIAMFGFVGDLGKLEEEK